MSDSKVLKVLLVEDNLEDEQLLREALAEIEENRHWHNWHTSTVIHVEERADAVVCLRKHRFDIILLNLTLPDSPAVLDSFFEVNGYADGTPIVVLADDDDRGLANRLIREGAQEVLPKMELEAASLARCLQHSIERQRRTQALLSTPLSDELTGVLTRVGFMTLAEQYRNLAQPGKSRLFLASLELAQPSSDRPSERESRDLILISAAETLRELFPVPSLIGRLSQRRFGLLIAGMNQSEAQVLLRRTVSTLEDQDTAGAHFVIDEFDLARGVEEQMTQESPQQSKTVMLAD